MEKVNMVETAVYEAIGGALSPHYEIRATDLREAARAACDAWMRHAGARRIEPEPVDPAIAEVADRLNDHIREWTTQQLQAYSDWLTGLLGQLPPIWTLCVHRRVPGSDTFAGGDRPYTSTFWHAEAHALPPGRVCTAIVSGRTTIEQYGPKPEDV